MTGAGGGSDTRRVSDGQALIGALRLVPKSLYSRGVGRLSRTPLPRSLRSPLIGGFSRRYDIDVDQAEHPLAEYESLAAFFTRRLRPGARPVCEEPDVVPSPADGRLLQGGPLEEGQALQAKGRPYSVAELLGGDPVAAALARGSYATVYLSPRDYHRVHCPVAAAVTGYLHVPGTLWPVNAAGVAHVDRLFCRNERLVTFLETEAHGPAAVVMVGATAVGRITVAYDEGVCTNRGGRAAQTKVCYDVPRPLRRGAELGTFHLGSTVIFLCARPGLVPACELEAPVRMGEPLLRPA